MRTAGKALCGSLLQAVLCGAADAQVVTEARCLPDGVSIAEVAPHAGPTLMARSNYPVIPTAAGIWEQVVVPPGIYLRAISMASPQVGFAAGELGRVIRTIDGGDTWQDVLNQGFPFYYYGCRAIDEQTVVVSGFNNSTGEGIVRWSEDGGTTWGTVIALEGPVGIGWLAHIEFIDTDHGIVEAAWSGGVHRTTKGGRTAEDWTYVEPSGAWFLGTFSYLADQRLWLAGIDVVFSDDGGQTFSILPSTNAVFDGPIAIRADGVGYVGGGSISPAVAGWIYRTADGGRSWTPTPVATPPEPVRGLLVLDEERAWAAVGNVFTNAGGVWATTDGGRSWSLEQATGNEMIDLDQVRIDNQSVDIYVAGYISQIWRRRVRALFCPADLDGDSVVGITDLLALLAAWGTDPGEPPDLDGDGMVGINDLLVLVALWGAC